MIKNNVITTKAEETNLNNTLYFTYAFDEPSFSSSIIENKKIVKVILDDLPLSGEPNQPCLPVKPLRLLLPPSTTIENIIIKTSNAILIQDEDLRFIQIAGIPKNLNQYSALNDENIIKPYNKDILYPSNNYQNLGVQYYRGWGILHINLFPVQMLGESNTLFYYPNIDIRLEITNAKYNNLFDIQTKNDIIKIVDNPEMIDSYQNLENCVFENTSSFDYVIITTEDLINITGVSYTFDDLIDYRRNQGLNCTIKTVESIINEYDGIDIQEKIRNFIKDAYINWGTRWILIGGDVEKVPVRYLYDIDGIQSDEDEVTSDLYYQCLDGNYNYDNDNIWGEKNDGENGNPIDLYAEVYIGRAPVDDENDVSSFVEKTIVYENSDWQNDDYLKKHLSVGEMLWNGPGGYGAGYAERCIDYNDDYNQNTNGIPSYKYSIIELYERDMIWDKFDLMHEINLGVNIINHVSHCSKIEASIDISDISGLINTNMYSLFYSQACHAGNFETIDECFAERWVNVPQRGGFAAIMNTGYGYGGTIDYDGADNRYAREFYDALYSPYEKISRIGEANQKSKEDNIWHINEPNMYHVYYNKMLFGDPYVEIKGAEDVTADFSWDIKYPTTGQSISFTDESIGIINYRIWDFGDGQISYEENPVHIYSSPNIYSVTLTVQDIYGFLSTKTEIIQVENEWPPFAIATPEYYQGHIFTVNFTGDQSFDPDGEIISYYWDFKDGDTSSQVNPTHTFLEEGTYLVEFTVKDDDKNVEKTFCEIVLNYQLPPNTPNTPNGPINTYSGESYDYTVSTYDPDGDKIKYCWDWGDGSEFEWSDFYNSGEVCLMTHTWNTIGKHFIRVKARDINNIESDWSDPLEITTQDNKKPDIEFIKPEKAIYIKNDKLIPFFTTMIFGTLEINISAFDSSGINSVEFYIDGEPKLEFLSEPYIYLWSEKSFGRHVLKIIAYDNAGNNAEEEIVVWKFL
jgi:PKD repeat protein